MNFSLGDRVRIVETNGFTHEGEVLSAVNYGTEADPKWEIDLQSDFGEYVIWNQEQDGGEIEKIGY